MQNATRTVSPPRANPFVTKDELSRWLRITTVYLRTLTDANIIHFGKNADGDIIRDRFVLFDAVGEYIAFLHAKRKEKPVSQTDLELARIKNIEIKTEREQIHNLMMKGTLCRIDDANAVVIEMFVALKGKLLGFGAHVASLVVGKDDTAEIAQILTDQMEQNLIDIGTFDMGEVRSRNRKLRNYTEVQEYFDQEIQPEIDAITNSDPD